MVSGPRQIKYVLLALILLLASTTFAAAQVVECHVCNRSIKMVWPVKGTMLAENARTSACQGGRATPQHFGYDLMAPDDSLVYAVFDGEIRRVENPEAKDDDPVTYQRGCGLVLTSPDGKYVAKFWHLKPTGMAADGEKVSAGTVIGLAGGGQDDPTCRGDSPGPRLYFELLEVDATGVGHGVDPYTCITNSCKFWYTTDGTPYGDQCTPSFENTEECYITRALGGGFNWPSYACINNLDSPGGVTYGGDDDRYYSQVTIDKYGEIDLTCEDVGDAGNTQHRCRSEIYNHNLERLIADKGDPKERLNCFLRFLRVYNYGKVTCGRIEGEDVNWDAGEMGIDSPATGECLNVVSLGISEQSQARNVGYLKLQPVRAGTKEENLMKFIVVSSEYTIIAVNDVDYVNKLTGNSPGFTSRRAKGEGGFNPNRDYYSIDYILARSCDLAGPTIYSPSCKDSSLEGVEGSAEGPTSPYLKRVDLAGYEKCQYDLLDGGKFFDEPGRYFSTYWLSRLAANRGFSYYG